VYHTWPFWLCGLAACFLFTPYTLEDVFLSLVIELILRTAVSTASRETIPDAQE